MTHTPPFSLEPASEAYLVPWAVDRSRAPVYSLSNVGVEPVRWVRVHLIGPGVAAPAVLASVVGAGERVRVHVRGEELADRTRAVVSWRRASDDAEYVWSFAL